MLEEDRQASTRWITHLYVQNAPRSCALFVGREVGQAYDLDASSIDRGCAGLCGRYNVGAIESCNIGLDRSSCRKPDAG